MAQNTRPLTSWVLLLHGRDGYGNVYLLWVPNSTHSSSASSISIHCKFYLKRKQDASAVCSEFSLESSTPFLTICTTNFCLLPPLLDNQLWTLVLVTSILFILKPTRSYQKVEFTSRALVCCSSILFCRLLLWINTFHDSSKRMGSNSLSSSSSFVSATMNPSTLFFACRMVSSFFSSPEMISIY